MPESYHIPSKHKPAQTQPVYLYVPANLRAAEILPHHLRRYAAGVDYLAHRITVGLADDCGFVPLKVDLLRKVVPLRVERQLRRAAVASGWIECDGRFVKGHKAMGYRFGPNCSTSCRRVRCTDRRMAERIDRLRHRDDGQGEAPVHAYLRRWLERLNIDADQAKRILRREARTRTDDRPDQLFIQMAAVDMIRDGHVEFHVCQQGRVHSLVTRLDGDVRPALRIDGKPLVNVDIANSQPLILGLVLLRQVGDGGGENGALDVETGTESSGSTSEHTSSTQGEHQQQHQPDTHTHTMCILTNQNQHRKRLQPDAEKYIATCEAGKIYEVVQTAIAPKAMDRNQLKKRFFVDVFFGRNAIDSRLTRAFAELFPTVAATIRELKKHDHAELPCLMQRLESSLVIGGVCARLMTERPDVPVVTVHDSIMTTAEHVDVVRQTMAAEFIRAGITPTIKVTDYGSTR